MATIDVDYVTIEAVIGAAAGDTTSDPDKEPDWVTATSGDVTFTPNIAEVNVTNSDGKTVRMVPFPIACKIDEQGRLTYNGDPFVTLVDLGSEKVNPSIPRDKAAYNVSFKGVKLDDAIVDMKTFGINPSDGDIISGDKVNLWDIAPLSTGSGGANIVRGQGIPSITTAAAGDVVTFDGADIKWTSAAARPDLIAALTEPFIVAHRGGALAFPENTLLAFDMAATLGTDILETDTRQLGDGTLVLMHDATVDYATDGTGPITDYVLPSFRRLRVDVRPEYTDVPAATLDDLLDRWAGRRLLLVQANQGGGLPRLLEFLAERNLQRSVLVELIAGATLLDDIVATVSAGFVPAAIFFDSPTVTDMQDAVTAGAGFVRLGGGASEATITAAVGLGKPVYLGDVTRRVQYQRAIGLGCAGVSTDLPGYVAGSTASTKVAPFATGTLGSGLYYAGGPRPTIVNGALRVADTARVYLGDLCPVAAAEGTYTISGTLTWVTLASSGVTPWVFDFAMVDDWDYANSGSDFPHGYRAQLNSDGTMSLYRNDGGPATNLGSKSTAALSEGIAVPIELKVTPTSITFTRTDTDDSITTTDSTHRGGYMRLFGRKTDTVFDLANLAIT